MFKAFCLVLALVLCTSSACSTADAQTALKAEKAAEAAFKAWERQWAATNPGAAPPHDASWTDKWMGKLKSAGDTFDVWRRAGWPITIGMAGYAFGNTVVWKRGNDASREDAARDRAY
jgi:hypothetical protein